MPISIKRRELLQATVAGGALYFAVPSLFAADSGPAGSTRIISPGCRRSKVRVGKLYMAGTTHMWPHPKLDLEAEVKRYEGEFVKRGKAFADVEFVGNQLITTPEQVDAVAASLKDVDGILAIHIGMGLGPLVGKVLALGKPTAIFAEPYAGHEWVSFGQLRTKPEGALLECFLTSDYDQLGVAVRPFRAIHHLREAKIIDVTTRDSWKVFAGSVKEKFGTEIKAVDRGPILAAYEAIPLADAEAEAERWIKAATEVVEPSKEEIVKSCRLALAFEKVLADEDATAITVDCYGTMYHQLPAFPCIGNTRLNNMGLAGICESDLMSAMTHITFQGLVGKPGFISDPTMDVSKNAIHLAHCLGSTKMDGPDGEAAPYRIRTIMERQEGAVTQVKMRVGEKVTQAMLVKPDLMLYFTGEIIEAPDVDRGCRTKILVKVDGDAEKLWENWTHGLHRVTCYGDISKDLARLCRYKNVALVNEAEQAPQV